MATNYLQARRAALYVITQASDGTYIAPTQASDKALQAADVKIAWEGGVVRVEDDVTPYGGGLSPYMGDIAATFELKLRIPAWPGSRNKSDLPAWSALLACMPLAVSEAGTTLACSPITLLTIGTAGAIAPASLSFLETGGDVWTLQDCVAVIDSVTSENGALIMNVKGAGLLRATITDTVMTLADAGLTIADVAYTSVTPLVSRGATLTLTGATGSGTFAVREGFAFNPGMALEMQSDRLSRYGYAVAAPMCRGNSALSMQATKLDADGKDLVGDYLSQTAISAATLVWGSGASRFALGLGTSVRLSKMDPGEDGGVRVLDIEAVGAPSSGNDQFTVTWGA